MAKIAMVTVAALVLAGCSSYGFDRNVRSGALVGAGTGAIVGGIARRSVGGAVAGGLIGAVAGAAIGAIITRNNRCYVRLASGRLRRIVCP